MADDNLIYLDGSKNSTMKKNALSFIIVNYNTPSITSECIRSIKNNIETKYEIIVVDNNSTDNSKEFILSEHNDVKWVQLDKNFGYGYAVNRGFENSDSNYIVILNSDIILQNDFSKELIKNYELLNAGCFGIELLKPDGKRQNTASSFPNLMTILSNEIKILRIIKKFRRYTLYFPENKNIHEVSWVTGAFMFVSSNRFKEISGFDEMFFMFYEDIDFCKKLCNLGYLNFYMTDFSAIHKHNYSVKKSKIDEYNLYKLAERKSAIYYVKKHFSRKIKLFLFFYYLIFFYKCLKNSLFLIVLLFFKRKRNKLLYELRTYSKVLSAVRD